MLVHIMAVYGDQHQAFKKKKKVSQNGPTQHKLYIQSVTGISGLVLNKRKYNII